MTRLLSAAFCFFFFFAGSMNAQLIGWSYSTPVEVIENMGFTRYGYQVLLRIDTQMPIAQGKMISTGDDIRFGDGCGFTLYDYWIEDYLDTDSTLIWVKLDSLPASDTTVFYLFYGNSSASSVSDFNATFPNAIVTGGSDVTLTGNINPGWLQVDTGDTLFIAAGDTLLIEARKAIINGVVWGKGRGYQDGGPSSVGGGPGGGGYSVLANSGSGGGGHGGNGGTGGYDAGDTPGAGGAVYGQAGGLGIDMGSAGGSSDNTPGGDGGGGFVLLAEFIRCAGKMDLSGTDGTPPGGSRGGGGGAGGGLRIHGDRVNLSGSNLSVNGGNGSLGTSTVNDSGGGGGGGRIKVLHGPSFAPGVYAANGGSGGAYGSQAPGQPGASGTVFDSTLTWVNLTSVIGPENTFNPQLPLALAYSDSDLTICYGDTLSMIATNGYSNYDFYLNGSPEVSGPVSIYDFTGLSNGDYVSVTATEGACVQTAGDFVTVNGNSAIITPSQASACTGNPALLDAGSGYSVYSWSNSASTQTISVTTGGFYSVTVADSMGCTDTASVSLTDANITATITASDPSPCAGDTVTLTAGGASGTFAWNTSASTAMIDVTAGGAYSVTVTDGNGCTDDDSLVLSFNTPPNPVITTTGNILDAGSGFTSYQWYFNSGPIAGGTNQTQDGSVNGNGSYSVVVTDTNGCTGSDTTSFTLGRPSVLALQDLRLYPNPAGELVNLSFRLPGNGNCEIGLSDLSGRALYSRECIAHSGWVNERIPLSELPSGVYLLNISFGELITVLKVVKE